MARFATLYSGSSGNSAAVAQTTAAGTEFLLVDMGKNCKQAMLSLQQLELDVRGLRVFWSPTSIPIISAD